MRSSKVSLSLLLCLLFFLSGCVAPVHSTATGMAASDIKVQLFSGETLVFYESKVAPPNIALTLVGIKGKVKFEFYDSEGNYWFTETLEVDKSITKKGNFKKVVATGLEGINEFKYSIGGI